MPDKQWSAVERKLWDMMFDPATYVMYVIDQKTGKPELHKKPKNGYRKGHKPKKASRPGRPKQVTEERKVARSWKLYGDWIRH
jgi:hypothetical protein